MSGRSLGPLFVNEFTAAHLEDLLQDELQSLEGQLHDRRDRADRLGWAQMMVRISGLRDIWLALHRQRCELGNPLPDDIESFDQEVERRSYEMPRSKANDIAWRALKAEDRARRERFIKARNAARQSTRRG